VLGFEMRGSYIQLALFALISLMMMLGFGLLIGGWAKNENQSAVLSNLISFHSSESLMHSDLEEYSNCLLEYIFDSP
jgi:hypothetical protein